MAKLIELCDVCGRVKVLTNEATSTRYTFQWDSERKLKTREFTVSMRRYRCTHSEVLETEVLPKIRIFSHDKSMEARPYQLESLEFARKTNYNFLNADAMGLGKTAQSLMCVTDLIAAGKKPVIIVVKSATTYQWIKNYRLWTGDHMTAISPVMDSKTPILPVFDAYVISMDLLGRRTSKQSKDYIMADKLAKLQPKCVIVDECHNFKEDGAHRTKALISLITQARIPHRIFLSGTPIKNRADEYFVVLNLIAPNEFPSYKRFASRWLETDGKRIRQHALQDFRNLTSHFIIRREKEEVLFDLPSFERDEEWITINDPAIKDLYNHELDIESNFMRSGEKLSQTRMLGWLQKMRHIAALAKLSPASEYLADFCESVPDEKIAVGIHHTDIRTTLAENLRQFNPIQLSGDDSAEAKNDLVEKFRGNGNQIAIISELAGGTGLDGLQVCNNVLVLERQWNASDEEQFESRFHRSGQLKPVRAVYMGAVGTIDQWFADMVREKRAIFGMTVSNNWQFTGDTGAIKKLYTQTLENYL